MERRRFLKTLCTGAIGMGGVGGGLALAQSQRGAASLALPDGDAHAGTKPNTRPALVIDLARCRQRSGCSACIDACHGAHNVPSIPQAGREVKWIWKQRFDETFPSQVHEAMSAAQRAAPALVLCNHCANPPCVRVCPTGATFRRADGLVMMDEHRCIGCRYCMAACPYGARSFNWQDPKPLLAKINPQYPTRTAGVVEKCTFCAERVAQGLGPVCVETCSAIGMGALTFGDLNEPDSPAMRVLAARTVLQRKPDLSTSPRVFYLT
jgi:Fe-S-cluster-containing dehydrogenase component